MARGYARRGSYPTYRRRRAVAPASGVGDKADYVALNALRYSNRFNVVGPSTKGSLKQQLRALQRYTTVKKPEQKFIDTSLSVVNVPHTTGAVVPVAAMAQGSSASTRIGDTITVTSATLKGQISPGSDTSSRWHYRFLLFYDKQNVEDGLDSMASVISDITGAANPINCLINPLETERYTVLWVSELYDVGLGCAQNSGTTSSQTNVFECFWTGNLKVSFNGSASSDYEKNTLFFGVLSDSTTDTVDIVGVSRVTYVDS